MKRQYLPALRGIFGDWVYYACLMPMSEVAKRVQYAEEIHKSEKLSDMIQRELKGKRGREIANYLLHNQQRFFNSLVVAVYGGNPSWHGFENFRPIKQDIDIADISEDVENSVGFLSFSGEEKIFALDGQHRLAGMREALNQDAELGIDEVPLIIVAHRTTEEGLRRTRDLFTTLNRTAIPVGKGEIIALAEGDVMAIVTRHLVENHPYFNENRIRFVQADNLPANNTTEFTTIGNLYDVLTTMFTEIKKKQKAYDLKLIRPSDEEIQDYIHFTYEFFKQFVYIFPPLNEYMTSENGPAVIEKYRRSDGGHVLFRPVGLRIMVEVIGQLVLQKVDLSEAFKLIAKLPTELTQVPYADVIWLSGAKKMNPGKRVLARQLLLHMIGAKGLPKDLRERYARQLGVNPKDCTLPELVV